ncbi:MAG: carboxypeptidase regulatory-like domain-containing protein, partial [Polyangia bacterium]
MFRSGAALLVCLLCAAAARAQATTGELSGVILDRTSERPLVGVVVTLVGTDRSAVTDDDGRFRLAGAPAGAQRLLLAAPGAEPVTIDEEVVAGRHRQVRYLLATTAPRGAYESTVRAPRVERAGVGETRVAREEARRGAGAGDDPLKVIEDLPGVARA